MKNLFYALLFLSIPNFAFADAGVPILMVINLSFILTLIPVITIECFYFIKNYTLIKK